MSDDKNNGSAESFDVWRISVLFRSANEYLQKYSPKYKWNVSAGRIVQGQNTSSINVVSEQGAVEIKATVEIEGLPNECVKIASETAFIAEQIKDYFPIEYGKINLKEEFAELDSVIVNLSITPNTKAFVHIYLNDSESFGEARKHIKQLFRHIKYHEFTISRFIFAVEKSHRHLTVIEIFPEKVRLPECKNCEIIKGENVK